MKYKYQVFINILILVFITYFIIYFIEKDKKINNSSIYYLTKEDRKEINKRYEELIKFCKENQKEIGEISDEFLSIMEADMPYEEYIELENKITHPAWARISETLGFMYNENKMWLVEYCHGSWGNGRYEWRVFYMVEEEEVIKSFLSLRYMSYRYQKINEHLYVCLDSANIE